MSARFDRFAERTEKVVSSSAFFAFCVLVILVWAPSIALGIPLDTWQLIVNTLTTIITFLLVALLTNTGRRSSERVEARLKRIETKIDNLRGQEVER